MGERTAVGRAIHEGSLYVRAEIAASGPYNPYEFPDATEIDPIEAELRKAERDALVVERDRYREALKGLTGAANRWLEETGPGQHPLPERRRVVGRAETLRAVTQAQWVLVALRDGETP